MKILLLFIVSLMLGGFIASAMAETITTSSTSEIKTVPPSAVSPAITTINNDVCTVGVSGAVQTQILGISGGKTTRDLNCERLKLSRSLFDMGMKVAAVASMCQDRRVFDAMSSAGTPCPIDGKIGNEARALWESNPDKQPKPIAGDDDDTVKNLGVGAVIGALLVILL